MADPPVTMIDQRAENSMIRRLGRLSLASGRRFADLLIPPLCSDCRTPVGEHGSLCAACWATIDFIRPPLCDRLGLPMPFDTGGVMISAAAEARPPDYDRARAVASYSGAMKELIHGLKYLDSHHAVALLARLLAGACRDLGRDADVIVPIPLDRWRLWSRRFNQSALIAQALATEFGIASDPHLLRRIRQTRSQVGLTLRERQINVKGAFAISPGHLAQLPGRRVLLVDDVITTGSTVSAAARALKRAGAARVDVAALALVTDTATVPE